MKLITNQAQLDQEFQSGMGFFAKSRDPEIFRDGLSLIFSSRDFSVNFRDLGGAKAFKSLFCLI